MGQSELCARNIAKEIKFGKTIIRINQFGNRI